MYIHLNEDKNKNGGCNTRRLSQWKWALQIRDLQKLFDITFIVIKRLDCLPVDYLW